LRVKIHKLGFDAERTYALFDRSRLWLHSEALKILDEPIKSDRLLKIVLGQWICERGMGQTLPTPEFIDCLAATEQALRYEFKNGFFRPEKTDTKLMLLCQRLLGSYGYRAHGIEQFTQELIEALSDPVSQYLPLVGERIILRSMGHDVPVGVVENDSFKLSEYDLLLSDKRQLREVCKKIFALTQYGSQLNICEATISICERLLPSIMCEAFRQYDLESGTIMLRVLCCLPSIKDDALVADAVVFLARQQKGDGSFGYFGNSIYEIDQAKRHTFRPFPDLYLPTAVGCLWSLAEALVPQFSLFSYTEPVPARRRLTNPPARTAHSPKR
jgi:hypothetical protein